MSFSNSLIFRFVSGAETLTGTEVFASGGELNVDESIPNSTTNQLINFAATLTSMKAIYILATGGNLTLKTNSSGSPDDSKTLVDGKALVWRSSPAYFANPFSASITSLYVSNSSGAAVTLQIRFLADVTP